jgi:hypothetical protein
MFTYRVEQKRSDPRVKDRYNMKAEMSGVFTLL